MNPRPWRAGGESIPVPRSSRVTVDSASETESISAHHTPFREPIDSISWLLLRPPDLLKEDERADLERVLAADELVDAGYKLVRRFRAALHELDVTAFKQWLIDAAASQLKPFARLAAGMTDDLEPITNAFRYPWSTGSVEDHITRVKLIKRAGYGRAKLPLLRARILGPN
jgi:transposase